MKVSIAVDPKVSQKIISISEMQRGDWGIVVEDEPDNETIGHHVYCPALAGPFDECPVLDLDDPSEYWDINDCSYEAKVRLLFIGESIIITRVE